MRISKTLFKGLTRCDNFASLYDMYSNTNLHHVSTINGVDVSKETVNIIDGYFDEEKEDTLEIFHQMFDEETGEDLTKVTAAQLEAFKEQFTEIEMLAGNYISQKFDGKIIYDIDTKKQKKVVYERHNHEYYCYLDIYLEKPDGNIAVFEVKSTTTNKFFKLGTKLKDENDDSFRKPKSETYDSLFVKCCDGIIRLKDESDITTNKMPQDKYIRNFEKLFNRYGSDGTGRYVFDLAIERFIVENAMKDTPNIEYYLVVLNGDYLFDGTYQNGKPVYHTDSNGNDIIAIIDLTSVTALWQDKIKAMADYIEERLELLEITPFSVSENCELKKTTECPFKRVCFSKVLKDGSILEYFNKHNAFKLDDVKYNVYELINQGYYTIDSIPQKMLSKKNNIIQRDCYVNKKTYEDVDKMMLAIKQLKYPLYHLDFETYASPLPRYHHERPYDQSLFQFSIHVESSLGKCDKEKDHIEFLAPDHQDHRLALCEKLIEVIDLSKGGTVVVYNESFEKTRIKEMATTFPHLKKALMKIHDAIFDLLYVLKGNQKMFLPLLSETMEKAEKMEMAKAINFYHNEMHGSFSIKKILPLFTSLSYQDLTVKNGTEAVLVYGLLPTYTTKEYEEYYLALRKYCQQDTWAMVEILWGIIKLGRKNAS